MKKYYYKGSTFKLLNFYSMPNNNSNSNNENDHNHNDDNES